MAPAEMPDERAGQTTSDEIYAWLRDQIVAGTLRVGDRIPSETELCERWQTSRGTVRQALERLILLGIITKVRGSGSYVASSSRLLEDPLLLLVLFRDHDLTELLQFRRTLDVGAARLCAEMRTGEDLAAMHAALADMQTVLDGPGYSEADMVFHVAIARGTHNAIHMRFYTMLQIVLRQHITDLNRVLGASSSLSDHVQIMGAIEERDGVLAGYFMQKHLDRTLRELQAVRAHGEKPPRNEML